MDRLKKGIAVLGVALLGFGSYTEDNLWAFLLGLALVLLCVASSKREGFGLNLIEAMACGLPVVAFDNRGHREVVRSGENGFLVPQGDVEEMARCVEGLMGAEYARFSASARAFAQERGQQVVTGEIVDILHQTRLGALPRRTGADK